MEQFTPITNATQLDALIERSLQEPILVFKHDPVCSISIAAYRQLAGLDGDIPMIDVKRSGPISQQVAAQTGVKHESPQVILFRNGEAVWSASHYTITTDAVQRAVSENG